VSTMDPTWDRELGTASPHREEINLLTSGLGPKTPLFRLAMFRRGKMKLPQITATYVAILALLYATLSLAIVRLRQRNRVAFGDGGNSDLAVRSVRTRTLQSTFPSLRLWLPCLKCLAYRRYRCTC
jgi:hypothetical protein